MPAVYVIEAVGSGRVKIGCCTKGSVADRVATLQSGSPYPLEIVWVGVREDPLALEGELHKRFAEYRVQGEWFERRGALAFWLGLAADAVDKYLSSAVV